MSEIPERLWLQWYGDAEESDPDDVVIGEDDVSWCTEQVFDGDIEYVRVHRELRREDLMLGEDPE